MESFKFNKNNPPPYEIRGGGYPTNQVYKNQSQVPFQYSNVQFNSMPGQNVSTKNYSSMPQPPNFPQAPVATNEGLSGAPFSHPSIGSNVPFQNSSCHLQPYPPTHIPPVPSSMPLHTSIPSSQSSPRPLFNVPPPSVIPSGNIDATKFGQFNFPPPPIPAPAPYFSHEYTKSPHSFPNNNSQQYFSNSSMQIMPPSDPNSVVPLSSSYQPSTMSQMISNIQSTGTVPENKASISEKENLLNSFLKKFDFKEKQEVKSGMTIAEFHSGLQKCFSLLNLLHCSRGNLASLLDSSQEKWEKELNQVKVYQDILSEAFSLLSNPNNLMAIQKKLKSIKQKRALKKKLRATVLEQKTKKEEERERLHQEIDKWFDNLKEKNEKMKRELEMKKEADNILAEVRKKIHEAKKTIEKLKVFEKLRSARQANAVQKGLFVQPEHCAKFEAKISHLRETMLAQLSNYEQEEKALQVMLETEQEDRREEEALWRKRKLMAFQQKKQKAILESLFGDSEEPTPDDPLFLFYQYQNSGNKSTANLVQIRHHWDIHLHEEGEPIPLQWVVAVPPSSSSWEEYCIS